MTKCGIQYKEATNDSVRHTVRWPHLETDDGDGGDGGEGRRVDEREHQQRYVE
jgi:hypothetical protein